MAARDYHPPIESRGEDIDTDTSRTSKRTAASKETPSGYCSSVSVLSLSSTRSGARSASPPREPARAALGQRSMQNRTCRPNIAAPNTVGIRGGEHSSTATKRKVRSHSSSVSSSERDAGISRERGKRRTQTLHLRSKVDEGRRSRTKPEKASEAIITKSQNKDGVQQMKT
jgi:hypothetical protein